MKITKPSKFAYKRLRRYYGICRVCGCEFSCNENECPEKDYGAHYCWCPEERCKGTVTLYSKKKYLKKKKK